MDFDGLNIILIHSKSYHYSCIIDGQDQKGLIDVEEISTRGQLPENLFGPETSFLQFSADDRVTEQFCKDSGCSSSDYCFDYNT